MAVTTASVKRFNVPLVILGAVLVVASFIGMILFGQLVGRPGSATPVDTQGVLVATRDLSARAKVVPGDVVVARRPTSDVPSHALTKPTEAVGLTLQSIVRKGETFVSDDVTGDPSSVITGAQTAYLPLPAGFVALTLPSAELQGVAGYIAAGDYINVEAVVTPRGASSSAVRTIFSNLRVIRVGPASDSGPRAAGIASSLTLVVTECQAEFLNWFVANASLKYTLLSYHDYQPGDPVPDASCPKGGLANGVQEADVRARWPGLV